MRSALGSVIGGWKRFGGVPGGVSVSLTGIAGWFEIFNSCGKVAPKSGFWVLRYRKYQLVSTLRLRRLVILPAPLLAPVAWLPCKFANGVRSTGTSPLDVR